MIYLVQFRAPDAEKLGRRFRKVEAGSVEQAALSALRSLRSGALRRYGRPTLCAHVAPERTPRHASGMPRRVHNLTLSLR